MQIDKSLSILVLVESPNKTKKVTEIIKKLGYKNVSVMATLGHTTTIANDKDSYHNTGVYPNENFRVHTIVDPDKYKVVDNIKAKAKTADLVLIASDPDREGENLGNHIRELIGVPEDRYYRIMYHSITPEAIKKAIENPTKMDMNMVDAAEARQVIDKMIGYRMSPIAKTYIGAKSVGRCQSAGLKLIVDREKEIEAFKPEKYFDIYLQFKKNKAEFKAKYVGTDKTPLEHVATKTEVDKIFAECGITNKYIVRTVLKRTRLESPKPPFCTATFQQEVASKLGLSVKDAMSCAQKIFEEGKITYMRTDDTDMSPEFIPTLTSYVRAAFNVKTSTPKKAKKAENAQEGHECLRITDPALTPDEFAKTNPNTLLQKVYRIIWQRTVASVMPPAEISETTYNIVNNGHNFNLVSNELLTDGYRIVYSYKDDDEQEESIIKETFTENEQLKYCKLAFQEKETQPKPRFKEATFIKELQKCGIGRPSTYATIVETVLSTSRGYCELDSKTKQMVPTTRGIQLVEFLDRSFSNIINISWTKDMEIGLDNIAAGKLTKYDFLMNFYNTLENTVKANKEVAAVAETPACPECGAPTVVRRSRFGKLFYGCSKYPSCHGLVNIK